MVKTLKCSGGKDEKKVRSSKERTFRRVVEFCLGVLLDSHEEGKMLHVENEHVGDDKSGDD